MSSSNKVAKWSGSMFSSKSSTNGLTSIVFILGQFVPVALCARLLTTKKSGRALTYGTDGSRSPAHT